MSYLGLIKQLETRQAEYREALRRWWASPDDSEAYQRVLCLMDELGVARSEALRDEEREALKRCRPVD